MLLVTSVCSYLAPENEPIIASWQQQREINPSCDKAAVEMGETWRLELRGFFSFFMKSRPCATRYLARTQFALMCINRLVRLRQNKINQKDPPNSIGPEKSDLNTSNHEPHETPRTLRANPLCVMLFLPFFFNPFQTCGILYYPRALPSSRQSLQGCL